jgi:type II secretion system protein G
MRNRSKGFTLIELLIVVAIIGIIAAIAIPNLLNAIDRGKQKRTMADLRSIGTAVESYAVDNNVYPVAAAGAFPAAFTNAISPIYIKVLPANDGWNNAFQVDASTTAYTLYSFGKDGSGTTCTALVTTTFIDQICFVNGQFLRYPQGTQQ